MIHYVGAEELKADEEAVVRGVAPTEADTPAPAARSESNVSLRLFCIQRINTRAISIFQHN